MIRSCTTGNVEQKAKVCSGWRCVWIGVCGVVGFSRMGTRWPIQQWSIPVHVGKHSTAFGENWISNAWMVTERTAHYSLFPSCLFLVVVHEALYAVELARIWREKGKKKKKSLNWYWFICNSKNSSFVFNNFKIIKFSFF